MNHKDYKWAICENIEVQDLVGLMVLYQEKIEGWSDSVRYLFSRISNDIPIYKLEIVFLRVDGDGDAGPNFVPYATLFRRVF